MKILIAPQFGIGDAILSTPALKLLKENLQNSEVTFFTFNKTIYDLFKTNKYIDKIFYYPLLEKSKIISFLYIIKNFSFKFDVCINFYPSNKKDYNIFSLLTFAKKRIGHRYNHYDFKELNWLKNCALKEDNNIHCVEENVKLLEFFGIKVSKSEIPNLEIFLTKKELDIGKNFIEKYFNGNKSIGIHPGTSKFKNHTFRRWPKENFLELIKRLIKRNFNIFIFGGSEDNDVIEYLKQFNSNKVIFVENKKIREVAAIIKNLDLFISNDSGLMHLAAAVGTSVVAILGPTNPAWISPWKVEHRIVRTSIKCSSCFYYSPKPLECKNRVKWKCLKDINVEMVLNTILDLLTTLK